MTFYHLKLKKNIYGPAFSAICWKTVRQKQTKKITKPLRNKYKIPKEDVKRVKKNLYLRSDESGCRVGPGLLLRPELRLPFKIRANCE